MGGGGGGGGSRDFAFDKNEYIKQVQRAKSRGEIDKYSEAELIKDADKSLGTDPASTGKDNFEVQIQRLRGTLKEAQAGKGKFGKRKAILERKKLLEDRPGRRATLVAKTVEKKASEEESGAAELKQAMPQTATLDSESAAATLNPKKKKKEELV
jgi:hypothetical protein